MVRMFGHFGAEGWMALETGFAGFHPFRDHIIRIAVMHGVTGEAGELPFLIAGGFQHAAEVPSGDAYDSIPPEAVLQEAGFAPEWFLQPGLQIEANGADDGFVFVEILAWAVGESVLAKLWRVRDPFDAVALAADLG